MNSFKTNWTQREFSLFLQSFVLNNHGGHVSCESCTKVGVHVLEDLCVRAFCVKLALDKNERCMHLGLAPLDSKIVYLTADALGEVACGGNAACHLFRICAN